MSETAADPSARAMAHIESAARALADHPVHARHLDTFIDHWGFDHYTPPDEVMNTVRRLVMAFVALGRELPTPPTAA